MKRSFLPVVVLVVGASALIWKTVDISVWKGFGRGKAEISLVQDLTDEFRGSYTSSVEANGEVVEVDLSADESSVKVAGYTLDNLFTYNGQIPGPTIRARLGDTVRVNFTNNLPQETTIHWHGVRVPNAMDGVPGVTQAPIKPGESFTYEFVPKDAGTFWFHPHSRSSEQVEKGLYGVLIVEGKEEPTYEKDVVWVLDDWRIDRQGRLYEEFNTTHDLMHDGRWGNVITVNGEIEPELSARPGERVRLRLVNTANGRVFVPEFSGPKPQVIAVDGMNVAEPFEMDGFELAPGNRIDLVLEMPTSSARIKVVDRFIRSRPHQLGTILVEGETMAVKKPIEILPPYMPLWKEGLSAPLAAEYVLNATRGGKYGIAWKMNGMAFPTHEVIQFNSGEFQRIRFRNNSARLHPMHLHGQFFKVLARDGRRVDEPYWRDTVLVHPRESVDIGLVPLDKGRWMNHCHILEHAESGMMTIIDVM